MAFKAYVGLYKAGLLNDNLLPLTSVIEPEKEEDVKEMLKDVEKRVGMASVDLQMDPWAGPEADLDGDQDMEPKYWFTTRMCIGDLPPLVLFTRSESVELDLATGPTLYSPGREEPIRVTLTPIGRVLENEEVVKRAREYTRRVFWSLNWARMDWDNLDFAYFFYPEAPIDENDVWVKRRAWLEELRREEPARNRQMEYVLHARKFGEVFEYATDPVMVLKEFGRPYQFVGWKSERLSEEEEEELRGTRRRRSEEDKPIEIRYPLLVVKPFHPRRNFLVPTKRRDPTLPPPEIKYSCLLPESSGIVLISPTETEYAFLLPSVLRSVGNTLTVISLRSNLFLPAPSLHSIPLELLANAITASSAGERFNYQRLETLGDTVLKFLVALQVLVEYPLWHEGYLTRKKDHTVSNVRLAKENVKRRVFRWIIRGMQSSSINDMECLLLCVAEIMLGRKWKPKYVLKASQDMEPLSEEAEVERELIVVDESKAGSEEAKKTKKKEKQDLSTKSEFVASTRDAVS